MCTTYRTQNSAVLCNLCCEFGSGRNPELLNSEDPDPEYRSKSATSKNRRSGSEISDIRNFKDHRSDPTFFNSDQHPGPVEFQYFGQYIVTFWKKYCLVSVTFGLKWIRIRMNTIQQALDADPDSKRSDPNDDP
jgi:hypothetical protein